MPSMVKSRTPEAKSRTPRTPAGGLTEQRETRLVAEADPNGRQVEHRRTVDVLDKLLAGGMITDEMCDAGRQFQRDFIIGSLHAMPMSRLVWAPGGTVMVEPTDRQYDARRRLALAIASLGGFGAAGTSAVWHVLGQGMSINGYASHVMWNGLKMERRTALGVLIAALAVLAGYYGYASRGQLGA